MHWSIDVSDQRLSREKEFLGRLAGMTRDPEFMAF
jgi:hypothetical protein